MSGQRLPVLWVCGASGAGKSVAAWGLFEELAAAGTRVAYVDIDQLGMLYPAADGDPRWHHAMKAEALATVLPGYAAAGAQLLLVSGVVDPHEGPRTQLPPGTDLTLCLLAPDPAALRERILARGWSEADAADAAAEDDLLRAAAFVDARIETAALSVAQTVARLRELVPVPGEARETRTGTTSRSGTGVVVITGPRAAGSSTVGFGLAAGRWRAGRRTGFLDLQQLGFLARDGRTGSDPALAIGRLAAMHELMTERGAELLVVSGHLSVADRAFLRAALPRAAVTVVRLRADEPTLAEHVRARVGGDAARLAGDDLLGADRHHQEAVVATALAEQHELDKAPADDDAVLDVTGRTPADTIAAVERLTEPGYPEPPAVGDEIATLLGSLERQRATFAWKSADLDAAGLRRRVGVSAVTLGGLLKHLAFMEDINFTRDLAARPLPPPWDAIDRRAEPDWDWRSAAADTPDQLYALWRAAVDRSRDAVRSVLAHGGPDHRFRTPAGSESTLRRLLVDMIEEYARHTGQADLVREAVDGRTGEDPPGRPYPYHP